MSNILDEYLIALGLKDDLSEKLQNTLDKSSSKIENFSKLFMKAGNFVGSVFVAANVGVAKFVGRLVDADDEAVEFAKSIGKSKEEAIKIKTALDAMGKTMEEVSESERLSETFRKLQADADNLKPPDFSDGLNQVREIVVEFTRLKQAGSYAVQWIGFHLFKYLQQPMQKFKEIFAWLNDGIIKNIPKWADKAAWFMSGIVKLGLTVIRGTGAIFNAVKKIFDMIPKELKIAGGAIAAFAIFIRAGPIGKLVAIITAALLLLEDFYTYLDGGDALLGNVWQKLINIWNLFKDSGGIVKIKSLFEAVVKLLAELVNSFGYVGTESGNAFAGAAKAGLEWFVAKGLPAYIDSLTKVITVITSIVAKMNEWGITQGVIKGIFAAFMAMKIGNAVNKIAMGFSGLSKTIGGIGKLMKANPFMIWIAAIGALITILSVLFKHKEKVGTFVSGIKDKIKDFLGQAKEIITELVGMIPEFVKIGIDFVKSLIDTITENLPLLLETGISILMALINGVAETIPKLIPVVLSLVNSLISSIAKYIPIILEAGIRILTSLINSILSALPKIIDAIIKILTAFIETATKFLPKIIKVGIQMLMSLIAGIINMLPALIQTVINLITSIIGIIVENLPMIINAGIQILMALINGIVNVLPVLIDTVISLVTSILNAVIDNLSMIIEAGISILLALIDGIVEMLPKLIEAVIGLVMSIIAALIDNLPKIIEAGIKIIIALISGLIQAIPKIVAAIPKILSAILNGFSQLFPKVLELGKNLISGLWDGIMSMGGWIKDKVGGFFGDVFGGIGDFFGGLLGGGDKKDDKTKSGGGKRQGHADGGIFDKEHNARFAEDDKPEAIIPLTKPKRAREILSSVENYLGREEKTLDISKTGTSKNTAVPQSINLEKLQEILNSFANGVNKIVTAFVEINAVQNRIEPAEKSGKTDSIQEILNVITIGTNKIVLTLNKLNTAPKKDSTNKQPHEFDKLQEILNSLLNYAAEMLTAFPIFTKIYEILNKITVRTNQSETNKSIDGKQYQYFSGIIDVISNSFEKLQSVVNAFNTNLNKAIPFMSKCSEMLGALNKGLNNSAAAITNNVTNNSNVVNHNSYDMHTSYTINDTSGRSEATANAISRVDQMRIRNLKGIL